MLNIASRSRLPTLPRIWSIIPSPLGSLLLTATPAGLSGLWIRGEKHCPDLSPSWQENLPAFTGVVHQLEAYFAGDRREFDLPLDLGGTPFQAAAWDALRKIPYGATLSYREQARAMGRASAVRAVGSANGKNPVSIIVPCHRVIGADGRLTGYGGGLSAKRWLLAHESETLTKSLTSAD